MNKKPENNIMVSGLIGMALSAVLFLSPFLYEILTGNAPSDRCMGIFVVSIGLFGISAAILLFGIIMRRFPDDPTEHH